MTNVSMMASALDEHVVRDNKVAGLLFLPERSELKSVLSTANEVFKISHQPSSSFFSSTTTFSPLF